MLYWMNSEFAIIVNFEHMQHIPCKQIHVYISN